MLDLFQAKPCILWAATQVEAYTVNIPAEIMSRYHNIILAGDLMMFVNNIAFFMTISRYIKFGTAEMMKNQQNKTFLVAINHVKSIYIKRGFQISVVLLDGQFESLHGDLADMKIALNTMSNREQPCARH